VLGVLELAVEVELELSLDELEELLLDESLDEDELDDEPLSDDELLPVLPLEPRLSVL
jgi:hypothetical protein